jgi:hypothetical protein
LYRHYSSRVQRKSIKSITGIMTTVANLLQDPSLVAHKKDNNVTVIVAGSRFCIVPSLWKKVQSLPWLTDVEGFSQLVHANPDTFELLLQYFLFGSLPSGLSKFQANDLMEIALPLSGVKTLIDHIETSMGAMAEADTKAKSSFLSSFNPRKIMVKKLSDRKLKYIPDTVYPFAANKNNATLDVDYLPNLEATDSTDSEESDLTGSSNTASDSSSIVSSNMESNKNKRTLLLKPSHGSSFFGGMKVLNMRSTKRKLTHEEWCASDYVL